MHFDQRDRDHAAQHEKITLRRIDHAAGVVDDSKAQRRERVDRPYRQAGKQELNKVIHNSLLLTRPAPPILSQVRCLSVLRGWSPAPRRAGVSARRTLPAAPG